MKYEIVPLEGIAVGAVVYAVRIKKAWYTRWKYVRDKKTNEMLIFQKKKYAQAYINFQNNPRIKAAQ